MKNNLVSVSLPRIAVLLLILSSVIATGQKPQKDQKPVIFF